MTEHLVNSVAEVRDIVWDEKISGPKSLHLASDSIFKAQKILHHPYGKTSYIITKSSERGNLPEDENTHIERVRQLNALNETKFRLKLLREQDAERRHFPQSI
jgi:hypothetical protein